MSKRTALSHLGRHVFGAAAILLGIVGIVSRDFAAVWQPVPDTTPHRKLLACIFAACFLLAGAAIQWHRTARPGAIVLAIQYAISAALWLPLVIASPRQYGNWGGVFEQLALVSASVVVFASAAPPGKTYPRLARVGCLLLGVCALSFGTAHFTALQATAGYVPKWIPPGQMFWAVATGVFHLLAGIAILTGILALLASRLLTAMILVFGVLIWAPALYANPHEHFVWAANSINLALIGAAWVAADAIAERSAKKEAALK